MISREAHELEHTEAARGHTICEGQKNLNLGDLISNQTLNCMLRCFNAIKVLISCSNPYSSHRVPQSLEPNLLPFLKTWFLYIRKPEHPGVLEVGLETKACVLSSKGKVLIFLKTTHAEKKADH
jgi:hypothetical protein